MDGLRELLEETLLSWNDIPRFDSSAMCSRGDAIGWQILFS
jgi:hypothetical protein